MTKTPQWKVCWLALKKGRRLTMLDGFKLCGTLNLHKRCEDIEDHLGIVVRRGWRTVRGRRLREFYV